MPLYDHFHGPLARRAWVSFHAQWAGCIAANLNRRLPSQFIAEAPFYLGSAVSADVAEREEVNGQGAAPGPHGNGDTGAGGLALATEVYAPPATVLSMPTHFPDDLRVEVREQTRGYRVLAVVEVVSPANKNEAVEREKFAAKCLSYLDKGIGLVVVDVVTERLWNLHNLVVRLAERDPKFEMTGDPPTYASAYRPVHRNKEDLIDLWHWPLAVGQPLPAVPLALKGFGCVRLDLEATYAEACERSRIP